MRKALDLFANVRPVRIPEENIDWTFFRENTEDLYAVGSQGINVTDDLAIDFRVITTQGSERIIEAAFAHALRNGKDRVTIVTKANIIKTTDGKFLDVARKVSQRYPSLSWDAWYIDIMTAKLLDLSRRSEFQVFALPNLYGDIITDEAARFRVVSARRAAPTSARSTPCSKPSTAAHPAWFRKAAPTSPTPAP